LLITLGQDTALKAGSSADERALAGNLIDQRR